MRHVRESSSLAALLIVGSIFLFFSLHAPLMADNFIFARAISPGFAKFYAGAEISGHPMTLAAAFSQACEMYMSWCGRFGGNLAVYLLFMLPRGLWCVLSSLLFVIQILLLGVCIFGRQWREKLGPGWIFALAALLWLAVPSFGEAYFWLSVGGQLALFAQAVVFIPYRLASSPTNLSFPWRLCQSLFFFLFCIFACSLDYAGSAALPPTAIAVCLWLHFADKISWRKLSVQLAGAFGLCLGGAITLLAPGNAQRLLLTNDLAVQAWLAQSWPERLVSWLAHMPLAFATQWLPLLWLAIGLYILIKRYGSGFWRHFPHAALLFLMPAILTHAAYLFTAWPPERAFATSAVQLLLCAAIVSNSAFEAASLKQRRSMEILLGAVFLIAALSVCWEAYKFNLLDREIMAREKLIRTAPGGVASLPPLKVKPDRWQALGGALNDISEDSSFWVNRAMASYYGLRRIVLASPSAVRSSCRGGEALQTRAETDRRYDNLKISINKNRIETLAPDASSPAFTSRLSLYYNGYPGILSRLPEWLAKPLRGFVGNGEGWRRFLVPLLFARADIPLKENAGASISGRSANLSMDEKDVLWLVNPAEGKFSTDIIPLVCLPLAE